MNDEKYEAYLKKYCESNHISREEAETHAVVRTVKRFLEKDDGKTKIVGWKEM